MKKIDKKAILENGMKSDFWSIISHELAQQIAEVRAKQASEEFRSLPSAEYKVDNEVMIAKIKLLENLQSLPAAIIMNTTYTAAENVDSSSLDPYKRPADFQHT